MIQLIILSAGSSKRFGEDKLMWNLDGKPMILHTIEKLVSLSEKRGWPVTLVTKQGPIANLASDYKIHVVINPEPERGISSSIKCGLASLPSDTESAVFFVADQPWLKSDETEAFISGFSSSSNLCGCVSCNGETGNPCAFSKDLFPELLALEGDKGGKKIIMKHFSECFIHEIADSHQLLDIDTKPE